MTKLSNTLDAKGSADIQNTRRRPGGGGPARPRGARAPVLHICVYICIYLNIFWYILIYFDIFGIFGIKLIYQKRFEYKFEPPTLLGHYGYVWNLCECGCDRLTQWKLMWWQVHTYYKKNHCMTWSTNAARLQLKLVLFWYRHHPRMHEMVMVENSQKIKKGVRVKQIIVWKCSKNALNLYWTCIKIA